MKQDLWKTCAVLEQQLKGTLGLIQEALDACVQATEFSSSCCLSQVPYGLDRYIQCIQARYLFGVAVYYTSIGKHNNFKDKIMHSITLIQNVEYTF